MILLDTHVWIWWVTGSPSMPTAFRQKILDNEDRGLGVSLISCWEVALKAVDGDLQLDREPKDWLDHALQYPGVRPIDLTLAVIKDAVHLPGAFHKDPADRFIVATSRVMQFPLLSADARIRAYEGVSLA